MSTSSVLVLNTQDDAIHKWGAFFPRKFVCTFTEDTSIAYLEIRDVNHSVIQKLLNVESGVVYDIKINRPIAELYFVPDALIVEKKLSITNITMDDVSILNSASSAGMTSGYSGSGFFFISDGTPGNAVCYDNVTLTNGVLSGFTSLVPGSLMFYRVILKEYVIGYVTGNTATEVTTSLIGYSDEIPKTYCFQPNIGRLPLLFAGIQEALVPELNIELASSSFQETMVPPVPFTVSGSIVERTSDSVVSAFASSTKQRTGIIEELF